VDLEWTLERERNDARYGTLTRGSTKVLVEIEGEEAEWTLELWIKPTKKWGFIQPPPKLMHHGVYRSKEAAFQAAQRLVQEMST
jgi:hypothetical protein